jgi:uncharacterized HAD superfamily protein
MIIACDIDGVICDPLYWVEKYVPDDWEKYFSHTLDFLPIKEVIALITAFRESVILVSGRPESNRQLTIQWLTENYVHVKTLFLRKDSDKRPTHEIKLEWYAAIKPDIILEDDPIVVAAARKAGYTVLQVHGYRSNNFEHIGDGIPFSKIFGHRE